MKWITAAALAAALAPAAAVAERLPPQRIFESPDISGPRARGVKLSPTGTAVTYIKTRASDLQLSDLWIADVAGGEPRLLLDGKTLAPDARELSEAEKARRERAGIATRGVVDYAWDDQGRFILAPVEGDLWLYTVASGAVRQLTRTPGDEIDAKVSPKGAFVSYVRQDNLYVTSTAGGPERAITGGGDELRSWGTAEFIAQEEMDRSTGYWWSPDETRIAIAFVDQLGVDVVDRPEVGATGAKVVHQRYPRPGRPNAKVDLWIQPLAAGGRRVKVDLGANPDIYLARVDWSKDGRTLYVQREARDQRRLDLLAVDPATGASRVILTETSPHWVDLSDDFRPLADGGFLWTSERSGARQIYLHGADGRAIRQVTQGPWPVDRIEGVDEARGVVIFGANPDVIERRLYSISFRQPGEPTALTPAGGWWTAAVAKTGGAFVGTYEDPTTPPQTALYRPDGIRVRWIEENALKAGHPFWPYVSELRQPTFGSLKAPGGHDIWWSMRTPPDFDPAKKYPVIVQVYGGPSGPRVQKTWHSPEDQILLDAGYILFRLDNRGVGNRDVAFKTVIDRRLGQLEVEDQLAGARYLQSLPYVDAGRIGVTGWSYGGYMTLLMLTAENSPFRAGVAGAPVTDWKLYDTHYTERFMGTPATNPQGYAKSEVLPRLSRLKPGALLLIHGMADDNVTFDHSTRVLYALQADGTPFETMVYPGLRHRGGWTPNNRLHRAMATLSFFDRTLKGR